MTAMELHRMPDLPDPVAAPHEGVALVQNATAVFYNGLGRYAQALAAAEQAAEHAHAPGIGTLVLPELIEAAARSGRPARAAEALGRLARQTRVTGTDWALGLEARSRALLSGGDEADALYREALARLTGAGMPMALARAHLLYGEWLRREGRRVDARAHLDTAQRMLTALGLEAFAARAHRERLATGATARRRTAETRDDLTPQERQIAQLAAGGQTNPEIASELFLSPRTVEWHLRKVFFKLGIRARKELRALVGPLPTP
jgi:DNA-binding CsgD family transcriptional regulator